MAIGMAPMSRRICTRALVMNAAGAQRGVDQPVVGGVRLGEISGSGPDPAQSKLPPSTMIPPMEVPCPPMNLVVECRTIFAPHSNGRQR